MHPSTPNLPGFDSLVEAFAFKEQPCEYKVVALRECPTPQELALCDTPDKAAAYWRTHIESHPYFNPECECSSPLHARIVSSCAPLRAEMRTMSS